MCGICLENCPAHPHRFQPKPEFVRRQRQHKMSPWIKRKMLADMTNARGRIRVWYLPIHFVDFYGNVGKYTIHGSYGYIYIYYLAFAQVLLKFMFHYYASLNTKDEPSKIFTIPPSMGSCRYQYGHKSM